MSGVSVAEGVAVLIEHPDVMDWLADATLSWDRAGGFVYFMQAGDGGPIKIGCSIDPWGRLWDILRDGYVDDPDSLVLRRIITGYESVEAEFHWRFDHLRCSAAEVPHSGPGSFEWFNPDPLLTRLACGPTGDARIRQRPHCRAGHAFAQYGRPGWPMTPNRCLACRPPDDHETTIWTLQTLVADGFLDVSRSLAEIEAAAGATAPAAASMVKVAINRMRRHGSLYAATSRPLRFIRT